MSYCGNDRSVYMVVANAIQHSSHEPSLSARPFLSPSMGGMLGTDPRQDGVRDQDSKSCRTSEHLAATLIEHSRSMPKTRGSNDHVRPIRILQVVVSGIRLVLGLRAKIQDPSAYMAFWHPADGLPDNSREPEAGAQYYPPLPGAYAQRLQVAALRPLSKVRSLDP